MMNRKDEGGRNNLFRVETLLTAGCWNFLFRWMDEEKKVIARWR